MTRAVVAIIGIVLVGGVAVWGLQAAAADAGAETTIDGETFTPDAGNVTELDHSNLADTYYSESVTVRDGGGNLVDPGADYVWDEDNGTIQTVSGGALDGASSATISYDYQTTTSDQNALIGITAMLPRVMGVLAPLLGVALLLLFLKG